MKKVKARASYEMDMVNGPLFQNLIKVAIPLVLSSLLQMFYTSADLIICNKFCGGYTTAAISSTNPLINIIVHTFTSLSVSAGILIARYFGQKNQDRAQKVVYTSMIFAVTVGLFVGVFGCTLSKDFLILMDTPAEVLEMACNYISIYFLGVPFLLVYNFGASILRATGDTKRPFFILVLSGILNIILNIFFVRVFDMDVKGVALATISSEAFSAIAVLLLLIKHNGFIHFNMKELKYYKVEGREIIKIGLPLGLQSFIFNFSNVLIQSATNSLGTEVVGANGAELSLEGFMFGTMYAVNDAMVPFVSANYGANRKDNIKKVFFYSIILLVGINITLGGILVLFRKPLLSLYLSTEESIAYGSQKLIMISATYFFCGFMGLVGNCLRGIKYQTLPSIISLVGSCGVRVLWTLFIFPIPFFNNLIGLMVCYPICWVVTSAGLLIAFIIKFKKLGLDKLETMAH